MKPILSTTSFSDLVIGTPFIWVSISTYVDNGTAKVRILAELGVRFQQ